MELLINRDAKHYRETGLFPIHFNGDHARWVVLFSRAVVLPAGVAGLGLAFGLDEWARIRWGITTSSTLVFFPLVVLLAAAIAAIYLRSVLAVQRRYIRRVMREHGWTMLNPVPLISRYRSEPQLELAPDEASYRDGPTRTSASLSIVGRAHAITGGVTDGLLTRELSAPAQMDPAGGIYLSEHFLEPVIIIGDERVAIIDSEYIELWHPSLAAIRDQVLVVSDGDDVTVHGRATLEASAAYRHFGLEQYWSHPSVAVFVGTEEEPVVVVCSSDCAKSVFAT